MGEGMTKSGHIETSDGYQIRCVSGKGGWRVNLHRPDGEFLANQACCDTAPQAGRLALALMLTEGVSLTESVMAGIARMRTNLDRYELLVTEFTAKKETT
jgi:hypothetical protein